MKKSCHFFFSSARLKDGVDDESRFIGLNQTFPQQRSVKLTY